MTARRQPPIIVDICTQAPEPSGTATVMMMMLFFCAEANAHSPHNERCCGWIYPEWRTGGRGRAVKLFGVAGLPEHHRLRDLARSVLNRDDTSGVDVDHAAIRVHNSRVTTGARHDLVA